MDDSNGQVDAKQIKSAPQKPNLLKRLLYFLYLTILALSVLSGLFIGGAYFYFTRDLPKISSLKDYSPPIITTVYSDDNRKIAEFYKERRIVVPISKIPKTLIDAFVAAEDARFYEHKGIDIFGIARAFLKNIEAGSIIQGGSTITQQVAKSFFLSAKRSYSRKIREAILAYRIDKTFSKEEILFLYLNQIYLGHGAYGVSAAAENYFAKGVSELNLSECAMLAGLPQAPSRYSPFFHPERAKQRQVYVLNRMIAEGHITNLQATEAINLKLEVKSRPNWYIENVPYYTEFVRQYIEEKYGRDILYKEGLKVYTAVNIEMQKTAGASLNDGLKALDKRQGYRGPVKHLEREDIEGFSQQIKKTLANQLLEPGQTTQGVIIAISEDDTTAVVRMGSELGQLPVSNMKWARKPDHEVASYDASPVRRISNVFEIDLQY